MADLQNVIGLLYRADWTQLSMSAEVRFEKDGDLAQSRMHASRPPGTADPASEVPTWAEATAEEPTGDEPTGEEPGGRQSGHAALLIAPGGRYRQESEGYLEGNDGEQGWIWSEPDLAPPAWPPASAVGAPPAPGLFCPSDLLSGFTLAVRRPVTACGRDAIAVTATPRLSARAGDRLYDRIEAIVDAGLGILLCREESFEGQRLTLTELTAMVLSPPEAADLARFAPPAGSRIGREAGEGARQTSSGPGRQTAKNTAGLAAGGLGALIRFAPNLVGPDPAGERDLEATMPSPEPGPHDPVALPLASDDLPYLLYRSGQDPDFGATLHQWHDLAAMLARVPETARAAGHGGVGYLLDAVTRGKTVTHTVARLRVSGLDRYRVDYQSRSGRTDPKTVACDGEHRWQVYQAKTMVGPAAPLPHDLANLVDSSWLFGCRLSGGSEITYRGRRAYQLRVTQRCGGPAPGPLLFFPADAIVDAETGCLLRLISYAGDRPASWWELRDFAAEPGEPGDFSLDVPPGVRTVEETGKPFTDASAVMPGATGAAVRTATGVVSATRSFLGDLRGGSRPPRSG
jgi:hypothetical protein